MNLGGIVMFNNDNLFMDSERNKIKTLPAAVQIEMARAAVVLSIDSRDTNVSIENINWYQPVDIEEEGTKVNISISPKGNNTFEWEIYAEDSENNFSASSRGTARQESYFEQSVLDISRYQQNAVMHKGDGECVEKLWQSNDRKGCFLVEFKECNSPSKDIYKENVVLDPDVFESCVKIVNWYFNRSAEDFNILSLDKICFGLAAEECKWAVINARADDEVSYWSADIHFLDKDCKTIYIIKGLSYGHNVYFEEAISEELYMNEEKECIDKECDIRALVLSKIKNIISDLMKIDEEKIDELDNLESFGFDSISLVELAGIMGEFFHIEITPDLFYSYSTIDAIKEYFCSNYMEQMDTLFSKEISETDTTEIQVEVYSTPSEDNISDAHKLKECIIGDLKQMVSEIMKIMIEKIEEDDNLESFGFDSISIVELAGELSNYFHIEITPDILFSYSTLEKIGQYLVDEYKKEVEALYNKNSNVSDLVKTAVSDTIAKKVSKIKRNTKIHIENSGVEINDEIAIIGMSGRFPDSRNVEELWDILEGKREVVRKMPEERAEWKEAYIGDKGDYRKLGVIPGISEFEPLFFEITPIDAENMDPRQRIILEETWKALEDAGYGKSRIQNEKIGIFIGAEDGDYKTLLSNEAGIASNSNAVMAARLAYFLNLDGPNMAINTACSSGLVAVHEACLSLWNNECDVAIAAGANLLTTPDSFFAMEKSGMLSADGRCHAFDKKANGMVPAEAVAVVVLKKLNKAEQDNNHIYASIIGSGINYDGKTNGITAPSGQAQAKLIREVYHKFHINPEDISYIVTHGTGTKLGDPIEINALSDVYKEFTSDTQYCALTSTKSNLGHSMAASGLVSLISLVMAMRKEMIPATINCDDVNDYIHWQDSPFYLNLENKIWKDTRERIGGVSAFGFSGTNAHVVLKSYSSEREENIELNSQSQKPYYLLVFSAKTEESLNNKMLELADKIAKENVGGGELSSISYTLVEGRQHFNHRCAVVVKNAMEAIDTLRSAAKEKKQSNIFTGIVERRFKPQEAVCRNIEELVKESRNCQDISEKYKEILYTLADAYCNGYDLFLSDLWDNKPHLMSLPSYPFLREEYWVTREDGESLEKAGKLHPLVHENTSDLIGPKYSSVFSGNETFFKDHKIGGRKILPGVAYLEMAREAVMNASGYKNLKEKGIVLSNIGWFSPVAAGEAPITVDIALYEDDQDGVDFEIFTSEEETPEEDIIHSQGKAVLVDVKNQPEIDLEEIKRQCGVVISSSQCYAMYNKMNMVYGESFRRIQEIHVGDGISIAKITMPEDAENNQFIMHLGVLDGALQSIIGMIIKEDGLSEDHLNPNIPFALNSLELYGSCSDNMWAVVKRIPSSPEGSVVKYDVDLCDEAGNVCVRMKEYASRPLDANSDSLGRENIEIELLNKEWSQEAVTQNEKTTYQNQYIIFCGMENMYREISGICSSNRSIHVLSIGSLAEKLDISYSEYCVGLFKILKDIFISKPEGKTIIQVIYSNNNKELRAFSGMLKTTCLERPDSIAAQLVEVDDFLTSKELLEALSAELTEIVSEHVIYQHQTRYVRRISVLEKPLAAEKPWKDNGVYLITGGAGGLGFIFAEEIGKSVDGAKIILTGRREKTEEIEKKIELIENAFVDYYTMDVSSLDSVKEIAAEINQKYGKIDGIIHSAGIIRDNYIIKKTEEEFQSVIMPKVSGVVNLDEVIGQSNLDFMILFSSTTGSHGNAGQIDYAAANAFMDEFSEYRNKLMLEGKRNGKTISINWPLWKNGGMSVDDSIEKMMEASVGLSAMPTEKGIEAFYLAWNCDKDEVICLSGKKKNIKRLLRNTISADHSEKAAKAVKNTAVNSQAAVTEELRERAVEFIKKVLADGIKLPAQKIDANVPMEEYGIDSIMTMKLTNELEKVFGSLPKTLFFEYQTIAELSEYFINSYTDKLTEILGTDQLVKTCQDEIVSDNTNEAGTREGRRKSRKNRGNKVTGKSVGKKEYNNCDIAIVGLAGKYPKAENIQKFWDNLKNGVDCVTEIPEDRWEYEHYFDQDKNKEGTIYCKWGGFIDGVDEFDPLFFNITPREAEIMEPQERLFLECVYETLEDAGYTREKLAATEKRPGNVGVYVGVMYEEYQLYAAQEQQKGHMVALSSNPASIANRISYYCNLHGPSMSIDTMCSSSLTAIHLACQSLRQGECEAAIAGGVNVSIHQHKYVMLSQGKFASSKGQCASFGEGGDGYVPGEGVGAILLKPLDKAIEDRDHIYGVIKGTSVNHGGKTNGFTVPNPNAQSSLIDLALKDADIDARAISYIEAHGTGTSLGDPIEIKGLTKTFAEYTKDVKFCSIGSAKSNIGHCESAAGIAGVTKVLLQMKYGKLVPSLHSETLNPYIDFESTPFVVQKELVDWKRPVIKKNEVTKEYPRIAGISAFGAGGSNAHVIIEEYPLEKISDSIPADEYLIVLSAKSSEQLKEQAVHLRDYIVDENYKERELSSIAYTLQTGREAMDYRVSFIVHNMEELNEKLEIIGSGNAEENGIYSGDTRKGSEMLSLIEKDMQNIINDLIEKKKYEKLLDLWTKGVNVDWNLLYPGKKPLKISLSTYPFANERYWVSQVDDKKRNSVGNVSVIHPLVHKNTSDLMEQRYSSVFEGTEYFFTNHKVNGVGVLPGAAYLEIAYTAISMAVNADDFMEAEGMVMILKNIGWYQPISILDTSVQVNIGLYPDENNEIDYTIYTNSNEEVIHSQGHASFISRDNVKADGVNIGEFVQKCEKEFDVRSCYNKFDEMGIEYGEKFKRIEKLYLGQEAAISKLTVPAGINNDDYILHPSILDGAFQTVIAFYMDDMEEGEQHPKLPFAIDEIIVLNRCTSSMWAIVRREGQNHQIDKFNMDLCDDDGNVCVIIKGYTSRAISNDAWRPLRNSGLIMAHNHWDKHNIMDNPQAEDYGQYIVILCGMDSDSGLYHSIQKSGTADRVVALLSAQKNTDEKYREYAVSVFKTIKEVINNRTSKQTFIQVVYKNDLMLCQGLIGILKSVSMEEPQIITQLVEWDGNGQDEMAAKLSMELGAFNHPFISYRAGERYINTITIYDHSDDKLVKPWKEEGVYLITGGAGGLGFIFANEIVNSISNAKIILTGRSGINRTIQEKLDKLQRNNTHVEYIQLDVTDKDAVQGVVDDIVRQFKNINGIIHSAGIIRDNYVIRKSEEEFLTVLAPKVSGVVNLDEASKNVKLDFMVYFSSVSGNLGNSGQTDYASANAFMNVYADRRSQEVKAGRCYGRTLSISWPLWENGGMAVDQSFMDMLWEKEGFGALNTEDGIKAFYNAFGNTENQIIVLSGDLQRIKEKFNKKEESVFPAETLKKSVKKVVKELNEDEITDKTVEFIKQILSEIIKLPVNKIDASISMEEYGIDSVMTMQMTNQLEKTFGSLSKTLFFEYQTIEQLSKYFVKTHIDKLNEVLELKHEEYEKIIEEPAKKNNLPEIKLPSSKSRFAKNNQNKKSDMDIAIIGVAGRYPKADNIMEFWENLSNGVDCITEIPEERWEYALYFDEDKNKPGKMYTKWGGFINGVDQFDPLFFNISPREAELIEPQERLFLQCVYEAIEDAGYTRENLSMNGASQNNVGVYVGVMYEEYQLYAAQEQDRGNMVAVNGTPASIANRVSYYCNFHGPSMSVDTMCSSSLTAIHLACQSIKNGECDTAIAGGVNVSIHPNKFLVLSQGKFASSKGQCATFGEGGDGYVPGEGVGAILLKPLPKALEEGDHIYGVIKATAVNHGGKTNGFTVPNPNAQSSVIGKALKDADIDARTISYIEAHGTGTSLGDPIEITGLSKTFEEYTKEKQFCLIGSAKSNIGHCESAAGIAGVTKVLLQMKYQKIAPSLHSEVLNPYIDFANSPFTVSHELTDWERPVIEKDGITKEYPRRAGISAFGAGGSNAHIVIEEYLPETVIQGNEDYGKAAGIIILSAKSRQQVREEAKRLGEFILKNGYTDKDLASIGYTLQTGREAMDHRIGFMVSDINELLDKLIAIAGENDNSSDIYQGDIKNNNEVFSIIDKEMFKVIDDLIAQEKYEKLLDLWTRGYNFDWNKLYEKFSGTPNRISLPAYPFANERYWVPKVTEYSLGVQNNLSYLHPLIHRNTSNFSGIRYTSTFRNTDTKITKYLKENQKCFADLVYAEMAKMAVLLSMENTDMLCMLEDIKWENPIYIDKEDVEVNISLYINAAEEIEWEIYEEIDEDDIAVNCEGHAKLLSKNDVDVMDINALKLGFKQKIDIVPIDNHYDELSALANGEDLIGNDEDKLFWYVEKFVEEIWIDISDANRSSGRLLVKLNRQSINEYKGITEETVISDNVIKACIQVTNMQVYNRCLNVSLLSMKELEIVTDITEGEWALICFEVADKTKDYIMKLNIEMCDISGFVVGRIAGLKYDNLDQQYEQEIINETDIVPETDAVDEIPVSYEFAGEKRRPEMNGWTTEECIIWELKNIICQILKIQMDKVNDYEKLEDFGFDSLSIVEFAGVINECYKIDITPDIFYSYYTVSGLKGYIYNKYYDQMEIYYCENVENIYKEKADQLNGNPVNVKESLTASGQKTKASPNVGKGRTSEMSGWTTKQCIDLDLKKVVNKVLKLKMEKIDLSEYLENFGFESMSLVEFSGEISEIYDIQFTPDLVYNYPTLDAIGDYLLSTYPEIIENYYREDTAEGLHYNDFAAAAIDNKREIKKRRRKSGRDGFAKRNVRELVDNKPIAIIGMSGRFPDAWDVDGLWNILEEGRDVIGPVDRKEWKSLYDDKEMASVRTMGAIPGIDEFEPLFFEISPRDAENMDPRQRIMLQETWKALEDAGYGKKSFNKDKIGIFVGAEDGDYSNLISDDAAITSNHNAVLAARLAYFLNMKGPNMTINTACSSGLVAVHQACLSLRSGECDTAIVAGVNILASTTRYLAMEKAGMLSKDGKCYAFDKRANGMVPGEAVAVVVLKRLDKAERDNNSIYATIVGSGINYDGKTNGITAPSGQAQTRLLKDVYDRFKINPEDISYIVTHGTGTKLGDPIEINALADAFKDYTSEKGFCALTSVKSNIGHSMAASGIVSLISLAMAMRKNMIPQNINCNQVNDYIRWEDSPFYINQENQEWKDKNGKRRMGCVSSFSFSGTNAHVVLQSYDSKKSKKKAMEERERKPYYLLTLSAKNQEALKRRLQDLADMLEKDTEIENKELLLISYTLMQGRVHFNNRCAVVVRDKADAVYILRQAANEVKAPNIFFGHIAKDFKTKPSMSSIVKKMAEESLTSVEDARKYQDILFSLAEFYCAGYEDSLEYIWGKGRKYFVKVPAYPFAKEQYWITNEKKLPAPSETVINALHPLLHENISDMNAQRFRSTIDTKIDSCFIEDNRLSHMAQIEMVRAALGISMNNASGAITMKDICYGNQIFVDENTANCYVDICPGERDGVEWTIYEKEESSADVIVNCMGNALNLPEVIQDTIEIGQMKESCTRQIDNNIWMTQQAAEAGTILIDFTSVQRKWDDSVYKENVVLNMEILKLCWDTLEKVTNGSIAAKNITHIEEININNRIREVKWAVIQFGPGHDGGYSTSLYVYDSDNTVMYNLKGIKYEKGDTTGNKLSDSVIPEMHCVSNTGRGKNRTDKMQGMSVVQCVNYELRKTVSDFLKLSIDIIDEEENLESFGFDSITLVLLSEILSGKFEIELTPDLFYSYPSIKDLREYFMNAYEEKMTELYKEEGMASKAELSEKMYVKEKDHQKNIRKEEVKLGKKRRPEMDGMTIKQCIIWELKHIVNSILKIQVDKIDITDNLESFGFDSINLVELSANVSEAYGLELTPDIFFSYPSIESFCGYLLENEKELMNEYYKAEVVLVDSSDEYAEKRDTKADKVSLDKAQYHKVETTNIRPYGNRFVNKGRIDAPVAVIGISGRFPGARNVDELWEILQTGREVISKVPEERKEWQVLYDHTNAEMENGRKMGVIPGVDEFDPQFFEISPREAISMDPKQRLMLQEMWKALEDAGYCKETLENEKVGMFVGAEEGDYRELLEEEIGITSNHNAVLAARLAYFLNMKGPNMTINTACSSGLVALHQACLSIRNGECDTAVVAGANILTTPGSYLAMEKAGMLSKDGKCYAFDKRANGMVPAEAVAVVVLKRLDKAQQDKNPIYATVIGSGINYDGKTNGITAPSGSAQADLMRDVYDRFHVNPQDISYIVTHGTGTKLGDPIEINALSDAFKEYTNEKGFCALTSTKSNIGHALAASGVVSFISLVMAMKKEMIPANINCEQVNDYIHWKDSPFYINYENKEWRDHNGKNRIGCVSAFGMSGTNAHVVLQSYSTERTEQEYFRKEESKPGYMLLFSAKNEEALNNKIADFAHMLESRENISDGEMTAISYTLMKGRQHFNYRCAVVVRDKMDAVKTLQCVMNGEKLSNVYFGKTGKEFVPNEIIADSIKELADKIADGFMEPFKYQKILLALAEFYCMGYSGFWDAIWKDRMQLVHLPSYPFLKKHFWPDNKKHAGNEARKKPIESQNAHNTAVEHKKMAASSAIASSEKKETPALKRLTLLNPKAGKKVSIIPKPKAEVKPLTLLTPKKTDETPPGMWKTGKKALIMLYPKSQE